MNFFISLIIAILKYFDVFKICLFIKKRISRNFLVFLEILKNV